MQPISANVGPLIAASATQIAASQAVLGAQGVAFNGVGATYIAANVAASQTLGAAGPVTLVTGIAPAANALVGGGLPTTTFSGSLIGSLIVIAGAGNSSGMNFIVTGYTTSFKMRVDMIPGPNNGVSATANRYAAIISIVATGATNGAITIGTATPVLLDNPRQIAIASVGNDSGVKFNIVGLDSVGNTLNETVVGANAGTSVSALDYAVVDRIYTSGATASTITVGTNGVAHSPWIAMDSWAGQAISLSASVTGTANYSLQLTNDDPNSPSRPITPANMNWQLAGVSGSTTSAYTTLSAVPAYVRTLLNSGNGSVLLTAIQAQNAPR